MPRLAALLLALVVFCSAVPAHADGGDPGIPGRLAGAAAADGADGAAGAPLEAPSFQQVVRISSRLQGGHRSVSREPISWTTGAAGCSRVHDLPLPRGAAYAVYSPAGTSGDSDGVNVLRMATRRDARHAMGAIHRFVRNCLGTTRSAHGGQVTISDLSALLGDLGQQRVAFAAADRSGAGSAGPAGYVSTDVRHGRTIVQAYVARSGGAPARREGLALARLAARVTRTAG